VNDTELVFDVVLAAPPERAFAAITEARHFQQWFCDTCESEPRVNGRLVMRWTRPGRSGVPFEARWVEFTPPVRAAFQGGHAGYPDGNAGTVWFELTADAGMTRLHVRHELPARQGYEKMIETWRTAWPRALERLQRHLAPAAEARA
jgi:uncharacterized protein YndB with AHSA1/START domain